MIISTLPIFWRDQLPGIRPMTLRYIESYCGYQLVLEMTDPLQYAFKVCDHSLCREQHLAEFSAERPLDIGPFASMVEGLDEVATARAAVDDLRLCARDEY